MRRGPQVNGYLTRRPPSQADAVGAGASVVGESSVAGGVVVAPSAAPKELSAGPSPIASSSAASSLASGAVGEAAGEYSSSAIHGNVGLEENVECGDHHPGPADMEAGVVSQRAERKCTNARRRRGP